MFPSKSATWAAERSIRTLTQDISRTTLRPRSCDRIDVPVRFRRMTAERQSEVCSR